MNNIGEIHSNKKEYEKALEKLEESLRISRRRGNQLGTTTSLNNIAAIHYNRQHYEEALTNLKESLEIRKRLADQAGIAEILDIIKRIQEVSGNTSDTSVT